MSVDDVERTVVHEIEGHALPRAEAASLRLSLFSVGTARGADDQEGRAVLCEEVSDHLGAVRKRELGLRHVAARAVEASADFVATAEALEARGAVHGEAIRIAARVHRGGGLARESVYVPAFLRVRAAILADPSIETVLRVGRVAVDGCGLLKDWIDV